MTGVGNHHHAIATASAEAQQYFDQGFNLVFGFNHEEAARSFKRAAELDPKAPMPHWGIFEHTRRMAEKLKPPLPIYVRLKAPPGIGAVQTLSNRHITIGEDRIVEMSEEDANCLIPYGWIKLAERSRDEV